MMRGRYGDGTMRLTVEQDVIFPNVPEANLEAMQQVRAEQSSPLLTEPLQAVNHSMSSIELTSINAVTVRHPSRMQLSLVTCTLDTFHDARLSFVAHLSTAA